MRMRDRHNIHRHNVAFPTTHPPLALGWSGSRTEGIINALFSPRTGPPSALHASPAACRFVERTMQV